MPSREGPSEHSLPRPHETSARPLHSGQEQKELFSWIAHPPGLARHHQKSASGSNLGGDGIFTPEEISLRPPGVAKMAPWGERSLQEWPQNCPRPGSVPRSQHCGFQGSREHHQWGCLGLSCLCPFGSLSLPSVQRGPGRSEGSSKSICPAWKVIAKLPGATSGIESRGFPGLFVNRRCCPVPRTTLLILATIAVRCANRFRRSLLAPASERGHLPRLAECWVIWRANRSITQAGLRRFSEQLPFNVSNPGPRMSFLMLYIIPTLLSID